MNQIEIKEEITFDGDTITERQLEEIIGTELRNNGYPAALRMTFRVEPRIAHLSQQARVNLVWAQEDKRKYDRVADAYMGLFMETGEHRYRIMSIEYREVAQQFYKQKEAKAAKSRMQPSPRRELVQNL